MFAGKDRAPDVDKDRATSASWVKILPCASCAHFTLQRGYDMARLRHFLGSLILAALPACAVATVDDGGGDGGGDGGDDSSAVGGTSSGGNSSDGSGGGNSSGGASTGGASTGGASTGGASTGGASTGGASTGGASTGGASTGGASSGGAGSGGASTGGAGSGGAASGGAGSGGAASGGAGSGGAGSGGGTSSGCDSLPTWSEWAAGSGQMSGDQVVYACTVAQAGCAGMDTGVDYIWECNQSHVPNCTSQNPQSGTSWTFVSACE